MKSYEGYGGTHLILTLIYKIMLLNEVAWYVRL
jgi:hypothetical protein